MAKRKMISESKDEKMDRKAGVKEGSKKDLAMDKKAGVKQPKKRK